MRGEEIREMISKMPITLLDGKTINVTICIGISSLVEDYIQYEPDALDKFIDKADIALFGAKEHIGVGRQKSKNQCWKYTKEVGRQVEETRKNKQDALDKAREKILEASDALKKQRTETVAKLLDEIEHQLNILRVHKRM
jgi:GGDEF domain-containing protein